MNNIIHMNGGGLVGGYPLCKKKDDFDATDNDERVSCSDCIALMIKYSLHRNYKLGPNLAAYQAIHNLVNDVYK